jgi:hypothetical protein
LLCTPSQTATKNHGAEARDGTVEDGRCIHGGALFAKRTHHGDGARRRCGRAHKLHGEHPLLPLPAHPGTLVVILDKVHQLFFPVNVPEKGLQLSSMVLHRSLFS